jgi:hypothetical protein
MNENTFSINLVSVPKGSQIRKFFNDEFYSEETEIGLFPSYKKGLLKYANTSVEVLSAQEENIKDLYRPIPYFIFGQFDLALISKIDDFNIGNRIFKPVHIYRNSQSNHSYKYHIISGIVSSHAQLGQIALDDITADLPWITIIRLKINSGILIGNGIQAIDHIKIKLQDLSESNGVNMIAINSFDTYEITLLVFSESCLKIQLYLNELRSLVIDDLNVEIKEQLYLNSLLGNYYKPSKGRILRDEFFRCHIFTATNSTYGIHLDYFEGMKNMPIEEEIELLTFVDVKPGHYHSLYSLISREFESITCCAGEDSMLIKTKINTKNLEKLPFKVLNNSIPAATKHFNRINTKIHYPKSKDPKNGDSTIHPIYLSSKIEESGVKFDTQMIKDIWKKLSAVGVPKMVSDRLLSVINDYNQCITDVHLFTYFIELKGFLFHSISDVINRDDKTKLEDVHRSLNCIINYFEKAFYCRLQQGYNYSPFTDLNIEFNGGVQSLLSSFNEIYVTLINVLNFNSKRKDYAFIYVTGENTAVSSATRLKINYFHLFHPELYLAIVAKEAFNGFNSRLDKDQMNDYEKMNFRANESLASFIKHFQFEDENLRDHYKEFCGNNMVEYFIIDYWVLKYWFNDDFRLYYYWVMATLLTTPENYIEENQIDDFRFVTTIHRILSLLHLVDVEKKEELLNYILLDPFDSSLQTLWNKYVHQITNFVFAKSSGFTILEKTLEEPRLFAESLLLGWFAQDLNDSKTNFDNTSMFKKRQSSVKKKCDEYFESLQKGEYIKFDESISLSMHLTSLSLAYLQNCTHSPKSLFRKKETSVSKNIQRKIVLPRQGGKPQIGADFVDWAKFQKYYHPYLFDPAGGIFINTAESRSNYLKLRTVFFLSLSDCTLKVKKRYFK